MTLLARGMTQKQIALELGIRRSTVRTHVHNALRANGYHNATQIVAHYQRECILSPVAVHAAVVALRSTEGSPEERMRAALQAALVPQEADGSSRVMSSL